LRLLCVVYGLEKGFILLWTNGYFNGFNFFTIMCRFVLVFCLFSLHLIYNVDLLRCMKDVLIRIKISRLLCVLFIYIALTESPWPYMLKWTFKKNVIKGYKNITGTCISKYIKKYNWYVSHSNKCQYRNIIAQFFLIVLPFQRLLV